MIETTSLTKYYGDTIAVDDLSLSIPEGNVFGFLGPNGAGKTTTMRMLTTLLSPTDGQALINGISIADRDAVSDQFGYLPESPPLYPELSAREQLSLAADLSNIPSRQANERIEQAGASVIDIDVEQTSLEDIFVEYTNGAEMEAAET